MTNLYARRAQIKLAYRVKSDGMKEENVIISWHEDDHVYQFSSLIEEARGYLSRKLGWDAADMTYFSVELIKSE